MPLTLKNFYRQWWQPWANTTLYLPLNWDITDPYNQVTYNWVWTSSFATWNTGVQAANFTWSNAINLWASTDFEQWTGEMTVLFWFTTSSPNTEQRCEFRNSSYYFGIQISSSKLDLAALTMKENWQAILYLNWNVETTINIWTFQTYSFQYWQYIGASRMWNDAFWRWMIKDFIIEKRERTVDEITNYYNLTKWNDWIQMLNNNLNNNLSNTLTPTVIPNTPNSWSWDVLTM